MPYHFGDVIVVPFPFTDQTTTKKRPVEERLDLGLFRPGARPAAARSSPGHDRQK